MGQSQESGQRSIERLNRSVEVGSSPVRHTASSGTSPPMRRLVHTFRRLVVENTDGEEGYSVSISYPCITVLRSVYTLKFRR